LGAQGATAYRWGMPVTYSNYLQVDALLDLQRPLSEGPEHDEMLFIVIHQVYELWFKQMLHESRQIQSALEAGDTPGVQAGFKRVLTILKVLVAQVDILETMTPVSFNSFRSRLEAASGFQSLQFRELEFRLGHRQIGMVRHHADTPGGDRLASLAGEPSIYRSFLGYLGHRGYEIPRDVLEADPAAAPIEDERVRGVLVTIYRHDPSTREVCERLVDLDEGFQEWRYRHVKMVERTIGTKSGTGGSAGAEYLRRTLFRPFFPDLWSIRSEL
jgi:tryptophan 2,3-dioxygenase